MSKENAETLGGVTAVLIFFFITVLAFGKALVHVVYALFQATNGDSLLTLAGIVALCLFAAMVLFSADRFFQWKYQN